MRSLNELGFDYDLLADKIANAIASAPKENEVLWDADQCCQYLHFTRRYFLDKVSKGPDFPKARVRGSLWLKNEVTHWAKR